MTRSQHTGVAAKDEDSAGDPVDAAAVEEAEAATSPAASNSNNNSSERAPPDQQAETPMKDTRTAHLKTVVKSIGYGAVRLIFVQTRKTVLGRTL